MTGHFSKSKLQAGDEILAKMEYMWREQEAKGVKQSLVCSI